MIVQGYLDPVVCVNTQGISMCQSHRHESYRWVLVPTFVKLRRHAFYLKIVKSWGLSLPPIQVYAPRGCDSGLEAALARKTSFVHVLEIKEHLKWSFVVQEQVTDGQPGEAARSRTLAGCFRNTCPCSGAGT